MSVSPSDLSLVITTDPGRLGCAPTKGDQANADLLNAQSASLTANNPLVPLSTLGIFVAAQNLRAAVETAALNSASPVQSICLAFRDLISGMNGPPFDTSNPANQQMVGALVQAGLMTAAQEAALLALGNKSPASYAEVHWGVGTVVTATVIRSAMGRGN